MRLQRRCARMALSTTRCPPSLVGAREVLVGGHPGLPPVTQVVSALFEVTPPPSSSGQRHFGHHACELRDVTLLSRPNQLSRHAERLQPAATARPRSGSRSTLGMSQRYVL